MKRVLSYFKTIKKFYKISKQKFEEFVELSLKMEKHGGSYMNTILFCSQFQNLSLLTFSSDRVQFYKVSVTLVRHRVGSGKLRLVRKC